MFWSPPRIATEFLILALDEQDDLQNLLGSHLLPTKPDTSHFSVFTQSSLDSQLKPYTPINNSEAQKAGLGFDVVARN